MEKVAEDILVTAPDDITAPFTGETGTGKESSDCKGLFEEANGGAIFLDEIGEAPLAVHVRLRRVLQERKIRVEA